jgi:Spy/CpxP family protein refolding chaperone
MFRFRHNLIVATIAAAVSILSCHAQAQPPGPDGPDGARGPGGPGGPGGPRGPGGFGGPGSILNLAQNPAVQEELKLKDGQKTKIQSLVEAVNQRRRQLREQMNPGGPQGPGGNGRRDRNNGDAGAQPGGDGATGGQNGGGGGGFGPGGPGGGGFGPGGPGGPGGRRQMDPEMVERFAAMREAEMELTQNSEQTLARILERGQSTRLRQIQLQMEGINALLRPDMIEKLNLDDEQVAHIRELLGQSRQSQFENGRVFFDMMRSAFPPNDRQNGGQGGGPGGPGGGPGGPGGPNFRDPAFREAMSKFMEKPEVKAKMEEMRTQGTKIESRLASAVNRVLGKRQASMYKAMLGAPFDLSQVRPGPGQGPGNRPGNSNRTDQAKTAGKAMASDPDEDEASTTKTAPKAKGSDAVAKPKRKSLRERRGLDE